MKARLISIAMHCHCHYPAILMQMYLNPRILAMPQPYKNALLLQQQVHLVTASLQVVSTTISISPGMIVNAKHSESRSAAARLLIRDVLC